MLLSTSSKFNVRRDSVFIFTPVLLILLFYNLADSLAPRGVVYWKEMFGLVYFVLFFIALIALQTARKPLVYPVRFTCLVLLVLVVGVAAVFPKIEWPLKYLIGDFAIISMLLLYCVLIAKFVDSLTEKNVTVLISIFIVFSLVSYLVMLLRLNPEYLHGDRFDSPHVFALGGLSALYFGLRGVKLFLWVLLSIISGILIFLSQWRAEILIFLVGMTPVLLDVYHKKVVIFRILVVAIAILILLNIDSIGSMFYSYLVETRFNEMLISGKDTSFLNRLLEAQDVLLALSKEDSLTRWIFGFGHGAMYPISSSFPEPNVTGNGLVHNIHIHVFLWLFRYGLFGLLVYLSFVFKATKSYFSLLGNVNEYTFIEKLFVISAMMLVIKSFFYTPINDPINLLIIVGFIFTSGRKKLRTISYKENVNTG